VSPLALVLAFCLGADSPQEAGSPPPDAVPSPSPSPSPSLRYPLGESKAPDLIAPGEPFKLVDLRYGLEDTNGTTHAFAARIKAKDWGYLQAEAAGERRALRATTQRLSLGVATEQGSWTLDGSYRARRFIAAAEASQRPVSEGGGWRLGPALSLRLSPDVELEGSAVGDTARPDDRFLRAVSAGLLWQWRAQIEMLGEYRREYDTTDADSENKVDSARLAAVAQWGVAEIRARGSLQNTDGRFPRRQMEGVLGARISLTPRLLAEVEAGGSAERGARTQSHAYRSGLTWFGRRFTLPRRGLRAERSLRLAREATAAGYNERRVFDDLGLRAERERLSLAPRREELRSDLTALYDAQVDERPVPLLGVEIRDLADALSGESTRVASLFVGLPWPPAPPWRETEAAVPFVRLGYERQRRVSGLDFEALTHRLTLTIALDREMDLVVGWRYAQPTALDLIRGIGARTTFEASYVYAFGR
jgi:hypothetical protein